MKKILMFSGIFGLILFLISLALFFYAGIYEFFPSTKQLPISTEIKDHVVEVDEITIHYRILGEKEQQPIVFIHGWGGPYGNNDPITTALGEQDFQIFTMEIPGLDRSSTPNESWSNDDYARFFAKVFQKLEIEKPIIVGQSFGGGVAASYASLFP